MLVLPTSASQDTALATVEDAFVDGLKSETGA